MRWNGSSTIIPTWNKWYAWYPVKINDEKIWLEYVYRKQKWPTKAQWFEHMLCMIEYQYTNITL